MKRVFVLGAGFSKPAGMPLATELLPLLSEELELDEMRAWLDRMRERLSWLSGDDRAAGSFSMNIEQVFHYARFDMEAHRLKHHPVPAGVGGDTPRNYAESVSAWLSYLEDSLRDVILEAQRDPDTHPINRWARSISEQDAVLTFNYDTLVERSLEEEGRTWNHGTQQEKDKGTSVFKLHGSIDWIVAHRSEHPPKLDLLFGKANSNEEDGDTGYIEDDCCLWRCPTDQLRAWIENRGIQWIPQGASPRTVGIAGLGAYKQLHQIPGIGLIWVNGMRTLYEADIAIVVGFSMSDFDAMAQLQFAEVARARSRDNRPLRVIVIDPFTNEITKERFRRVFRSVDFQSSPHEQVDWTSIV